MSTELSAGMKSLLNAAATYVVPPVTWYRYGRLLLGLDPRRPDAGFHPELRDPEFIRTLLKLIMPLARCYFRLQTHDVHHVPREGAALLVGNHNGGLQPVDSFFTAGAIAEEQGADRAVFGLAHDYLWREPSLADFLHRVGGLRAHQDAARMGLDAGGLVLVYPGGDVDTFRPFDERNRICMGDRKGFIKTALRAGVPIVPVVSVGAHEAWFVLSRGEKIAAALDFKHRLRTEVCPIVLALPLGLTSGMLPYLPLPAKMDIRFLPPIRWKGLAPRHAEDPEVLARCYDEVVGVMQTAMDEMVALRKYPVIG
ncbi:MAG: glycerol acyltransferase [Deltaproteobacteria bacterium HGW-Deltaproteobacteria-22]|jgi:1-acyl-sn-glycerol-3-phosphate acyltransferase|nr:MAG: glycerol acyltransferase [Deltaproteobacteria bacterium HGW-Deltaproteobacteria-22]